MKNEQHGFRIQRIRGNNNTWDPNSGHLTHNPIQYQLSYGTTY